MSFFKSGSIALDAGLLEKEVTGLALSFAPAQVVVSLRQPNSDADFVTAAVSGAPTEDGFSVSFSSPIPSEGYILDWCAMGDETASSDSDSLSVDYAELMRVVARFLGYDADDLTTAQRTEVDACVQAGVRNFYYPPHMEGVDDSYEWSFLRQACAVSLSEGVADYRMADGFGKVHGAVYFAGEDVRVHPLAVVSVGAMLAMRRKPERGTPRFAAFQFVSRLGSKGQFVEMMVYPTPERAYELEFRGDSDTGRLSETRPFPLGGPAFSELVTESCLAVAEQRSNDELGLHTSQFRNLLVSMIAKDRGRSGAVFGQMGDVPDFVPPPCGRLVVMGGLQITYHGKTW